MITSLVAEKTDGRHFVDAPGRRCLDDLVMLTSGSAAPATLTTQDSGLLNPQADNAPGVNNYSVLGNSGLPVVRPGTQRPNCRPTLQDRPG